MIWLGIIIGIVVMQLINFIALIITKENEEITRPLSVFLFMPFVCLRNRIIDERMRIKTKRKLKGDKE